MSKAIILAIISTLLFAAIPCSAQDVFNKILCIYDSTSINQITSTWYTYSGAVNLATVGEAWCSDTILTDTLGAGEYMILHRATIWGAVLADRYIYSIHVRMNGKLSDGNPLTYDTGAWGGTDTIGFTYCLDMLADGAVMVFQPGDTFHIDLYNDDSDTDSLGYMYTFERIVVE